MFELKNERILVTGGSGFLGRHLCELLRADGCRNLFTPRREDYDLVDREAVKRMYAAFAPTVVIHLAARVVALARTATTRVCSFTTIWSWA